MLAAAFLSCVRSSGSCITSSRKPITRIFSSVFCSKSWRPTQEQQQSHCRSVVFLLQWHNKINKKRKTEVKVNCTCACLETQWRSTFKTLFVAALLITNSLSPFLWSVGKPGTKFNRVTVKLHQSAVDVTALLVNGSLLLLFACRDKKKCFFEYLKTIKLCSQLVKHYSNINVVASGNLS